MSTCIHRNHPVHIIDGKRKMTSSSFIPFCEIGGNMSIMGTKVDQFDVPVCNSFQARILNDQLCYEVDLNRFSNQENIEKELKSGFAFIMDYNEDRQVTFDKVQIELEDKGLVSRIVESHDNDQASIYMDTIGN